MQPSVETVPEIALTEDQYERIEQVRADIEAAYIDSYGYVPVEDVIEYLLDTYTPPDERERRDAYERIATAEYPQLQRVASDVSGVPGSGIDADEMRGKLLAALGAKRFAAKLEEETDPGDDPEPATDSSTGETGEGVEANGSTAAEGTDRPATEEPPAETTADGTDGAGGPVESPGDDPLAAVNRLLRDNADKWRESGGDEPYEVDLPDGTTEAVRTRDDVRQLLFRHY